jgi:hypothetical protein
MIRASHAFLLFGLCLAVQGGTVRRHWSELSGLRSENSRVVTKDGLSHRGSLVLTDTGAILVRRHKYDAWIHPPGSTPEIPKGTIVRVVVRGRYQWTLDELDDKWWFVFANWKGIFYPELSNLFPIAIVAHVGYTCWTIASTPVVIATGIIAPPSSQTFEIIP